MRTNKFQLPLMHVVSSWSEGMQALSHVPLPVLMCQLRVAAMGGNLAGNQEHMASFTNQNKA